MTSQIRAYLVSLWRQMDCVRGGIVLIHRPMMVLLYLCLSLNSPAQALYAKLTNQQQAQINPRPGVARLGGLKVHALLLWLLLGVASAWGAWTADATSICTTQSEAAATTSLTCSLVGANIEAGNVAVVVCATDNVTNSADGLTNDHGNVTDSTGANTWTKAKEFTTLSLAAGAGATVSVHFSKLASQISTGGGTITCNFASVTDKAMHLVREFTITGGNVVSSVGTPQTESSTGDAGSLTLGSLTSAEYLWVRGIATESNAAISMTATVNFARSNDPTDGCNNTATGGEASDIGACSEWDIATGTTNTSDPALVDTTNDNASVFVALQEAAPAAERPKRHYMTID